MVKIAGNDQVLENIDIVGMKLDRLYAMLSIASRSNASYYLNSIEFFPNLMDEPSFREDLLKTVVQRALNGISKNQVPTLSSLAKGTLLEIPQFFPKFNTEAELIAQLYDLYMLGLKVPGDTSETMDRRLNIEGSIVPIQLLKDESNYVQLEGARGFIPADANAVVSQKLVDTVKELLVMKASQEISDTDAKQIIERIKKDVPSKSKTKISLADLIGFYGEIQTIVQDKSVSEFQKIWLQTIFINDIGNIESAIQKVTGFFKSQEQKPTKQMLLEEAAKIDMIAFYKENSNSEYSLFSENIEPLLSAGAKSFNAAVREYKANSTEYEGQLKMLHNIMSQY